MWKLTKYSSFLGSLILIASVFGSSGAPQQAAGASIAIGLAVIPYCIARASSEIEREKGIEAESFD